jgi:hypothetical protein
VLASVACVRVLAAQEPAPVQPDTTEAPAPDTVRVTPTDTAAVRPEQEAAEAAPDSLPPVSPLGALVRSLVVPGWGQTAVGKPARGAVYFAAASASLFMVFKTQAKLNAARAADPVNEGLVDSRSSQRENWIVLYGFIAFLSGLDAWVSTHFWDFEPEVTVPEDGTGVQVGFRFPDPFR